MVTALYGAFAAALLLASGFAGTRRRAAGPRVPAVVTMLVLVVAGASIWRRAS
ncbi:hypothetical protein ABZS66_38070 [Dactylosporangium sp. NPDC005572]|uniref:hypothetical protein n=1 Tax=Dactylosporangium sp. NPDC005572 TaxID=3156889 RepID=UPI0033B56192